MWERKESTRLCSVVNFVQNVQKVLGTGMDFLQYSLHEWARYRYCTELKLSGAVQDVVSVSTMHVVYCINSYKTIIYICSVVWSVLVEQRARACTSPVPRVTLQRYLYPGYSTTGVQNRTEHTEFRVEDKLLAELHADLFSRHARPVEVHVLWRSRIEVKMLCPTTFIVD